MKKSAIFLFLIACFVNSCSSGVQTIDREVISWGKMTQKIYSDLPTEVINSLKYTVLDPEQQDYMFADADKIVFRDGVFYILDWMNGRVVAYSEDGKPVLALSRQGRAENEYLEISDFDVDEQGNLWILDGSAGRLIEYSPDCEYMGSSSLSFEAGYLKYISGGNFLFALEPWDTSEYEGRRIVLTDSQANVLSAIGEYDEFTDQNYSLPTFAFSDGEGGLLYHIPICDDVCKVGENGEIEKVYSFDFGSRAVPDKIRSDIESNREKFGNYTTLVKSVYVDDNLIAGCVLEDDLTDFIIDRSRNVLYLQDDPHKCLMFMGVTGGRMVYLFMDGSDAPAPWLPEEILGAAGQGKDVLISIDSATLSSVLR